LNTGEVRKLCIQAAALKREPFYAFKREPVLSHALTAALDCIERVRVAHPPAHVEAAIERFDLAIENLEAPRG